MPLLLPLGDLGLCSFSRSLMYDDLFFFSGDGVLDAWREVGLRSIDEFPDPVLSRVLLSRGEIIGRVLSLVDGFFLPNNDGIRSREALAVDLTKK